MHSSKQTGVEKGSTKERKSMIFQDWRRAGGGAGRGGVEGRKKRCSLDG